MGHSNFSGFLAHDLSNMWNLCRYLLIIQAVFCNWGLSKEETGSWKEYPIEITCCVIVKIVLMVGRPFIHSYRCDMRYKDLLLKWSH